MKKFEKNQEKLFTTVESSLLARVMGGNGEQPTETLATLSASPAGTKTDVPGSPNDGNDGVSPAIYTPPY